MPREAPDSTYPAGAADSPVGPDELEGAEFGRARKGFAPDEVTELLRRAAGALRLALERADHLEEELAVARRDTERLLAEAADEATEMVAEAQRVRERVLADLGRRRRIVRRQIDQLRAGRDRLLSAYQVVRRTADEATQEMTSVLPEARLAAEAAGRRPEHSVEPTTEQLEEELAVARAADLPVIVPDRDEAVSLDRPEPLVNEASADEASVGEDSHDEDSADEASVDEDSVDEANVDEDSVDEASVDDASVEKPTVEELFAHLRAERAEATADAKNVLANAGLPNTGLTNTGLAGDPGAEAADPDDMSEPEPETKDIEPEQLSEPEEADASSVAPTPSLLAPGSLDEGIAAERTAAIAELGRTFARSMKRAMADDQNELLDAVRRWTKRSSPTADALLPAEGEHHARYAAELVGDLAVCAGAGARVAGGAVGPEVATAVADDVAGEVTAEIRSGLAEVLDAGEGDGERLADGIRSRYRGWRGAWVTDIAERRLGEAFDAGVAGGLEG